jgi:hypothetical protein
VGTGGRFFLAFRYFLVFAKALSYEAFSLLLMPPTPSFDYLSYTRVVVTSTNIEFEVI